MGKAVLYQIVNKVTLGRYIGVTTMSLNNRWSVHLYRLRNGKGTEKLQKAYNEYGERNFIIEKILEGDKYDMYLMEKEKTRETVLNGYNVIIGGNDTEERKSASLVGHLKRVNDPIHAAMVSKKISDRNTGRVMSDEARKRMSISHLGKKWAYEKKEAIKIKYTGTGNPNYGKYRLYLNNQTGVFYDTKEMYEMLNTTKSGLVNKFKQKHFDILNFIKV